MQDDESTPGPDLRNGFPLADLADLADGGIIRGRDALRRNEGGEAVDQIPIRTAATAGASIPVAGWTTTPPAGVDAKDRKSVV